MILCCVSALIFNDVFDIDSFVRCKGRLGFTRKESDGNGLITVKMSSTKLEATINEQDSVDQKKQVLDAVQDWLNSTKDSLSS